MEQQDLFRDESRMFEDLCTKERLRASFKAVRKNRGAPGIDGVSVEEFSSRQGEELSKLLDELVSWRYRPKPVRRVTIQKPGKGAKDRQLGIPCVRDRVVQTALKNIMEPVLERSFSDNSYGFRPGRSQRQAVQRAQAISGAGKPFVVDIDLSNFFDRVHHDRLIHRLKQHQITDTRILRLIGQILRSGVMQDGLVTATQEGTVQGGPLSPLLSNVVLTELDRELEKRGLSFCRYADDCNIYVRTRKAAERVMESVSRFIEGRLKLVVNREKSKVAPISKVKFLGMTIIAGMIAISAVSQTRAMAKVKELTPRGHPVTLEQTVDKINSWYMGWSSYYGMTQYPSQLLKIEAHIRRRLRARLVGDHKRRKYLYRKLVKRGIRNFQAFKTVYSNKGRWALSHANAVEMAYPNRWFIKELGLKIRSNEMRPHWEMLHQWIRVT